MGICSCFTGVFAAICGCCKDDDETTPKTKLKGTVVLMRKNVLDVNDYIATVLDNAHELVGQRISFQLVSATAGDPNNNDRGIVGREAYLEKYTTQLPSIAAGDSIFHVTFEWDESEGVPGAIIVKNRHGSQFYLKSVTLDNFPGEGRIHFVCNSWVYPVEKYTYDRVFFRNKTYLPGDTPRPLKPYREEELEHLRGDDVTRKLEEWDRVYGYAYYNDLGEPEKGSDYERPVLGGSAEYPYPRRGKTGRPHSKKDPKAETRLSILFSLNIYVPRDERFGHLKLADFLAYSIKSLEDAVRPALESVFDRNEFKSFQDVLELYEGGLPVPHSPLLHNIRNSIPFEMIKELFRLEKNQNILKMPVPQVIQQDKWAWRTDEEFAREMLAGVNPVMIRRLEEFPPVSKLDYEQYGNQNSTITEADLEKNLEGLTVQKALEAKKLFILDYHDVLIPYLNRINSIGNFIYASRTLLLLKDDSTLKPLAIELSIPNPEGEQLGAVSNVYTPAEGGIEGSIWQLAKAYACVNDSGYHQLISHWLLSHAAIEPFVMATNRHLSALHPINKLLIPHYRDTMNINALARQLLINAGGILETTVFPRRYAMEMSSVVYKNWNFTKVGLPADLINRGVAVEEAVEDDDNNLELLIKDYPYAVDGLEIWNAIKTWVADYCSSYYPNDDAVKNDVELQKWWNEVREVGHGDKKNEPWWPKMESVSELIESCTTIIWIASAYHAAVNFGQYPYAGYLPNRPTVSRRPMPEPGTEEYKELATNPDKVFLKTITSQFQTILGVSLIEILSTHSTDEIYLGQRDTPEWTADELELDKFKEFGARLEQVEANIIHRNGDLSLKNRNGPVQMPYTLLIPTSVPGLTGKGIPNSVSI